MKRIQDRLNHRYSVFILLYVAWCISYIDRAAISLAATRIASEFNLGPSNIGLLLSSFYFGYALMQIPGGRLAGKFGAKPVIVAAILAWSAFTGLTGLAWSFVSILTVRFAFGFGEGMFPAASVQGIAEAFSKENRPKATTFMLSSNYLGSFIAPLIIAPLILNFGWRAVFHYIGLAGLLFSIFYWAFLRDNRVVQHSSATSDERKGEFAALLRQPLMWKILGVWFGACLVNSGLESWMPTYLMTERGLNLKTIEMVTPLPYLIAFISTAIGGWVIMKFFDGREKYVLVFATAMVGVFLYMMYTASSVAGVVTFQCGVYFFKSFILATVVSLPTKILSRNMVGTGIGMVNFGGQLAALLAPMTMGFIVETLKSYNYAFGFLVLATAFSVLVACFIKSEPLASDETVQPSRNATTQYLKV
ncbi:MFS transporter [Caballeronia megalochromosomata]|nr:MFS transporter [Caballeronia megalochromosomata]